MMMMMMMMMHGGCTGMMFSAEREPIPQNRKFNLAPNRSAEEDRIINLSLAECTRLIAQAAGIPFSSQCSP
jgi:hypothetical protein